MSTSKFPICKPHGCDLLFGLIAMLVASVAAADHPCMDNLNHQYDNVPITGQTQSSFFYQLAHVHICCGYGYIEPDGNANWNDPNAPGADGITIVQPFLLNRVVGHHQYSKPGVYAVFWTIGALCVNGQNSVGYNETWRDQTSGAVIAYIFDAPTPTTQLTCPLSITRGKTATCTVVLANKAPKGGTQIRILSDNTAALTVPLTDTVPAGQTTRRIPIKGGSTPGQGSVYVTSGEGTAIQRSALPIIVN